jgi:hypothetical protein
MHAICNPSEKRSTDGESSAIAFERLRRESEEANGKNSNYETN